MKARRSWDRSLDRISSGIYEYAVRLHRGEHERLARRAASALQFQERLAELKGQIARKRAMPTRIPIVISLDESSVRAA